MKRYVLTALAAGLVGLAGLTAGGIDRASADQGSNLYKVTIQNLTDGQPFSPAAVITHRSGMSIFATGAAASAGIQAIAENGDASVLATAMRGASGVTHVVTQAGPTTPGGTTMAYVTGNPGDVLSLATMLVCTNDGFTGANGLTLPASGSSSADVNAYDAGTETNSEASKDIVDGCAALTGANLPADGNARTAENGTVAMHGGITGSSDLAAATHDWSDPVARITIERVPTKTWTVTVTNLSTTQPLTPPVVAAHSANTSVWRMGTAASEGVRKVAEEGNHEPLVAALEGSSEVFAVKAFGGPLKAGETGSATIMAPAGSLLSITSMIVCTNDGYTGADSRALAAGTFTAGSYDAGTEVNSEASEDIVDGCAALTGTPLASDGNARTAENGVVAAHQGIIGNADLARATYGWADPIVRVTVAEGTPAPATPTKPAPSAPNTGSGVVSGADGGTSQLLLAVGAAMVVIAGASLTVVARRREP